MTTITSSSKRPTSTRPTYPSGALLALGRYLRDAGYRFTTVTPATHARINDRVGNELGSTLAELFGWNRPFVEQAIPAELLQLLQEADLLQRDPLGWRSKLRVASLGDQIYFHSAFPTEAPAAVFFGPDSYRFAALLEQELPRLPTLPRRAVDIGCGAGPGALTLARQLHEKKKEKEKETAIIAADINPAALELCRINAALAGLGTVEVCESNLLHQLEGRFDLIIANPPYLADREQRTYRHGGGPLGGALSLAIVETALDRLAPGGTLLLYTGSAIVQGVDLLLDEITQRLAACSRCAWHYRELDPDIFGEELDQPHYQLVDRIAAVALILTRSG